jgi:hypothetical protein
MPESLDQSLKLTCHLTYLGLTYLGLFSLTQHRQSTSRTLFLVLDELALHLYLYCSTVCVFSALRFLFIVCWHLAGQRLACTTTPNSSIVLARQWHAGNVSHARWLPWLPARHGRYTPRPRHHSTHPSVSGSRNMRNAGNKQTHTQRLAKIEDETTCFFFVFCLVQNTR